MRHRRAEKEGSHGFAGANAASFASKPAKPELSGVDSATDSVLSEEESLDALTNKCARLRQAEAAQMATAKLIYDTELELEKLRGQIVVQAKTLVACQNEAQETSSTSAATTT